MSSSTGIDTSIEIDTVISTTPAPPTPAPTPAPTPYPWDYSNIPLKHMRECLSSECDWIWSSDTNNWTTNTPCPIANIKNCQQHSWSGGACDDNIYPDPNARDIKFPSTITDNFAGCRHANKMMACGLITTNCLSHCLLDAHKKGSILTNQCPCNYSNAYVTHKCNNVRVEGYDNVLCDFGGTSQPDKDRCYWNSTTPYQWD